MSDEADAAGVFAFQLMAYYLKLQVEGGTLPEQGARSLIASAKYTAGARGVSSGDLRALEEELTNRIFSGSHG